MRFIVYILISLLIVSCKKQEDIAVNKSQNKKIAKVDFGFNFANFNVIEDTVKVGDSFGLLLQKQNIGTKKTATIFAQIKDTLPTNSIRAGKAYVFLRGKTKKHPLQYFIYQKDGAHYTVVNLTKNVATAYTKTKPVSYKNRVIGGVMKESLSETLSKAGVSTNLANKLTKIYSWSIDFFKIKKGDRFAISITERYVNDTVYDGVDSLKASFFEYKGKIIYAFPFKPTNGKLDYYDEEAKTLKNFFLKAPIKFSRITSRFSTNRFHPVQQQWKAHKGTDYAAPTGTPIATTAAGIVEATGYSSGNGNFVKVKHNATYATQYLHMSRILVKRGQQVKQGDIIGRVGSTGLATGPHVCYRFWKNGIQVDALRLNLPMGQAMEGENKTTFLKQIEPLKRELDSVANL